LLHSVRSAMLIGSPTSLSLLGSLNMALLTECGSFHYLRAINIPLLTECGSFHYLRAINIPLLTECGASSFAGL
jgi:hypothetical protein